MSNQRKILARLETSLFINTPISCRYWTLLIGIVTILLLIILYFVDYTETYAVRGFVTSEAGAIQIYPEERGILKKMYITPGMSILKGAKLFSIDTTQNKARTNAFILSLQQKQSATFNAISRKKKEIASLTSLRKKHFISEKLLQIEKENLRRLEEEHIELTVKLKHHEIQKHTVIYSPISGTVSNMMTHIGEVTHPLRPLATIHRENTPLIAELWVAPKSIGFIEKGQTIYLRYDAWPYQQFGSYQATILHVSSTITQLKEKESLTLPEEAYYKVIASIKTPLIMIQGKPHAIQHGMTLTAALKGPKRKLFAWFFKPMLNAQNMETA